MPARSRRSLKRESIFEFQDRYKCVTALPPHLTISIDGATPETYKSTRGARLETLITNLKQLAEVKRSRGSVVPRLTFKSVVMKQNLEELPTLVELGAACGVGEIELNNLVVYNEELESQTVFDQRQRVDAVYADAVAKAEGFGIRMFYGGVEEKDGVPACPFRNFTVTCDGTVGPCGAQRFAMGNIHDTALRDLWNHEELVSMRRGYARKDLPHQCEHCPGRTNNQQDHLTPDLTYITETLDARKWEQADGRRAVRADPVKPPCNPSTEADAGGCGTVGGGCS